MCIGFANFGFVWKPRLKGSDPNIQILISLCSENRVPYLEVFGLCETKARARAGLEGQIRFCVETKTKGSVGNRIPISLCSENRVSDL